MDGRARRGAGRGGGGRRRRRRRRCPGASARSSELLQSGRKLAPQGKLVTLGNFPTGGALTRDGRFYWTVSTGRGRNDIRIVSVRSRQGRPDPPAARRVGRDRHGPVQRHAPTSPVSPDSEHKDEQRRRARRAARATSIHVFSYAATGRATFTGLIPVPPPSDAPAPQSFPPTNVDQKIAWPDRLAVSPRRQAPARAAQPRRRRRDRRRLLQAGALRQDRPLPLRRGDPARRQDRPGLQRDARHGLGRSTSTPAPRSRTSRSARTSVTPRRSPSTRRADRAYVARGQRRPGGGDRHQEARGRAHAVGGARRRATARRPSTSSVTPDGAYLLVAEAGADELAVFKLPARARSGARSRRSAEPSPCSPTRRGRPRRATRRPGERRRRRNELEAGVARAAPVPADYALVGRIPVGSYPADVEASPRAANACAPSAKRRREAKKRVVRGPPAPPGAPSSCGSPARASARARTPRAPTPTSINDDNAIGQNYLPSARHRQGRRRSTSRRWPRIRAVTPDRLAPDPPDERAEAARPARRCARRADQARLLHRAREPHLRPGARRRPRAATATRARRSSASKVTPNIARARPALPAARPRLRELRGVDRRPLLDERGQGLRLRPQGLVPELRRRASGPYDFGVYAVTWPAERLPVRPGRAPGHLLLQLRRGGRRRSSRCSPTRTAPDEDLAASTAKFDKSDLGNPVGCFPNDASIGKNAITAEPGLRLHAAARRAAGLRVALRLLQDEVHLAGRRQGNGARPSPTSCCPNDHTEGATPGRRTPRAMVADNDYALGQIVDLDLALADLEELGDLRRSRTTRRTAPTTSTPTASRPP